MTARKLAEGSVTQILDYIRSNIGAALDAVGAAAGNPGVSLENPRSYFIYEKPQGYSLPAVFVILDEMDFKIQENKANYIDAVDRVNVSIVVEDQDAERCTYKAWRYQSALHSVLDQATIISSDNRLKLVSVVYRNTFSPLFIEDATATGGSFRKEIVLHCEVTHLENF